MTASNATAFEKLQFTGNRLLMRGMKLALGILPLREPKLLVGISAQNQLADIIAERSLQKVLIVTTAGIIRRGQADELIRALEMRGITPVIYDGISPDPTFAIVNEGLDLLKRENCDGVVAFGGGHGRCRHQQARAGETGGYPQGPEKTPALLRGTHYRGHRFGNHGRLCYLARRVPRQVFRGGSSQPGSGGRP
jgi:hypothetical protein